MRNVVVKGAGDLASGVAYRLARTGWPVIMTELPRPLVVRRTVSFAEAVFEGMVSVEGMVARRVAAPLDAASVTANGEIAVVVDPAGRTIAELRPAIVVDAIMAKRNTGTCLDDAPVVIGLGPGFRAPVDVHAVVETNRGHRLGRVIFSGEAEADTGVPGVVDGHGADRVLRAPMDGVFRGAREIGDAVRAGDVLGTVGGVALHCPFDGRLRGLIHDGIPVRAGMKVGDVDPRATRDHCFTISDKALAIGGGVLEAALYLFERAPLPLIAVT
ncbi:MAG: EF2563 family selenium-dependent molybdenum hydroxylase system protein [Chloroflexota bacterium]|nr:EF2563 family selenium-dependent molybdenum hydroxylase system protein [Chloroflexota bacterium]MDE3192410.1 EF2563 family selenium-dependent molybdenum hydroxylase system protein [Chloroflexota bacterium]